LDFGFEERYKNLPILDFGLKRKTTLPILDFRSPIKVEDMFWIEEKPHAIGIFDAFDKLSTSFGFSSTLVQNNTCLFSDRVPNTKRYIYQEGH
jgi:hypothetical protein